jgi:serine/threonine protein kinase
MYGLSQNPDTKDYIIVLEYANGSLNDQYNNNIKNRHWNEKLEILGDVIKGLKKIHENKMVHRDFHTGNILILLDENMYVAKSGNLNCNLYITDMGLCREVDNINETNIYGVMPFVAPEVLKGKPYTQAADIYSFGMIMYFMATGKQPFFNCAHDSYLALNICNGIRPEINEQEAPKFYIKLMKKCWNSNPNNRPNAIEIEELIELSLKDKNIQMQIEKVEEYKKLNLLPIKNDKSTHSQAYYTSRLLNLYIKDLSKYDNVNNVLAETTIDFSEFIIN